MTKIAVYLFFFFKQKTAYEIVSRDWSSDVCSSDLASVPPEEGGLGNGPAPNQQVDRLDVVGIGAEATRDADAREGLEQRRTGRGQPGVAALPEGRVDRHGQHQREVGAQAAVQADGVPGGLPAHNEVPREAGFAPGELAHRAVHELV